MEGAADSSGASPEWRKKLPEACRDSLVAANLACEANGRGEHMLALLVEQQDHKNCLRAAAGHENVAAVGYAEVLSL
jgi:hypothetical protein